MVGPGRSCARDLGAGSMTRPTGRRIRAARP